MVAAQTIVKGLLYLPAREKARDDMSIFSWVDNAWPVIIMFTMTEIMNMVTNLPRFRFNRMCSRLR